MTVYTPNNGGPQKSASNGFVLDDGRTNSAQYNGNNGTITADHDAMEWSIIDSPAIGLTNFEGVQTDQRFRTYFMYKPPGADSIWVTLRILNWNWAGAATKSVAGTWMLDPDASSFSANPNSQNSIDLPLWTDYATHIP